MYAGLRSPLEALLQQQRFSSDAERLLTSVRRLGRVKLALLAHFFQSFARYRLNTCHCVSIVRVNQLQAQASNILVMGPLAEHFVGEDLFSTP
jgi:hypothetical protein